MVFANSRERQDLGSKCPKEILLLERCAVCPVHSKKKPHLLILKGMGLIPNPPSRAVTLLISLTGTL